MSVPSRRLRLVLVASALSVSSCGSSEADGQSDNGQGTERGAIAVEIQPPKLYSAYIEGSSQRFQVPAIVAGVRSDSWECSDPDAVDLDMNAVPNGVLITTRKAGRFKLRATSDSGHGEVALEVSDATEEQLMEGLLRYNEVVDHDFEGNNIAGVMQRVSCRNCHAGRDAGLAFEYTPQQFGGDSDEEMKAIFSSGMKLPGTAFGTFPNIEKLFPAFHQWAGTDAEYQALVVYLRSFRPESQDGLD